MKRVEWTEVRDTESVSVIAEEFDGAWKIFEKSCWEIRWYQIDPSPAQLATLEKLKGLLHATCLAETS